MQELQRREGEYCFIRGNPNDTRLFGANSWRRVKYEKEGCFTIDEPKNWVMLDIDELEMREDERPTFEDAKQRVIEEFDFIGEEDVKKWLNGGAYKVNSKYYCGKDCVDKNTHSVPDCNTIGREKCENPLIIIPLAATGSKKMKKPKHKTIHNKKKKDKKKKKTISHVHK